MSTYRIGETEGRWILMSRQHNVELWHNRVSNKWGVYLYRATRDEDWLLYAIRNTRGAAEELMGSVLALLGSVSSC
jgi:hypothetical protein